MLIQQVLKSNLALKNFLESSFELWYGLVRLRIRQWKKVIVSWLDVLNDPKQQMYNIFSSR